MRRNLILAFLTMVFLQTVNCVVIYQSVREQRDSSYTEGVALYEQHKYEEANEKFKTVVNIDPNYRDAKSYLNRTQRILTLQKKQITRTANVNYVRGVALMKQKKYADALPLLLLAEEQNSDLIDVDDKIAECREKLVPAFERLLILADRQKQRKQYLSAYATCLKARMYNPSSIKLSFLMNETDSKLKENAAPFQDKGKAYFDKKQYDPALKMYLRAQKAHPWDPEIKQMIEKTNAKLNLDKNYRQAILLFNKKEYFSSRNAFAEVNAVEPNYKATEQYLVRIKTAMNSQIGNYYNNGVAFYEKGKYQAAINEFNKVLSINPNHSNAMEYRSRAQTKLNLQKSVEGSVQQP